MTGRWKEAVKAAGISCTTLGPDSSGHGYSRFLVFSFFFFFNSILKFEWHRAPVDLNRLSPEAESSKRSGIFKKINKMGRFQDCSSRFNLEIFATKGLLWSQTSLPHHMLPIRDVIKSGVYFNENIICLLCY